MPGLADLMREAQKMQRELQKVQERVGAEPVEGNAGGGMVTVAVAANREKVVRVAIDPQVFDKNEIEMLQDLIAAAMEQALVKAKERMEAEMKAVTGGMKIPGMM